MSDYKMYFKMQGVCQIIKCISDWCISDCKVYIRYTFACQIVSKVQARLLTEDIFRMHSFFGGDDSNLYFTPTRSMPIF